MMKSSASLFLSIFISSSLAGAAPLCARVMMPEISAADISSTVRSLALMKLQIDQLRAKGSKSAELTMLMELFPVKVAELHRALSDRYTDSQLRGLLIAEIAKLQNSKEKESQKDRAAREKAKSASPVFLMKRHLDFAQPVFEHFFEYFPENNFVLFQNKERTAILKKDLTTGTETVVFKNPRNLSQVLLPQIFPDGKSLLVYNLLGGLWKVDLKSGDSISMKNLEDWGNVRISPDGTTIFASNLSHVFVYDIATQTQQKVAYIASSFEPAPLTATTILVSESRGRFLLKQTDSDFTQSINTKGIYSRLTKVSDDGTIIALFNREQLEIFDINNPGASLRDVKSPFFANLGGFVKVPGHDMYIANSYENNRYTFGLISLADPTQYVFKFDYYDRAQQPQFSFSRDMKSAAVFVKNPTQRDHGIDLWEQP